MTFSLLEFTEVLRTCPLTSRLWIAYSGGLDSHVLLDALAQLRERELPPFQTNQTPELRAIHVHHGLQAQADEWVLHCQKVCEHRRIPCEILRICINTNAGNIEANAREARYAAIANLLAPNDVVLTAHHADDQAETLLLQLLRGAGVPGLAAMPRLARLGTGWLLRPLLDYPRHQLREYAEQAQLHWIEDDSNANQRFDRNFLRHDIMPRLQGRWQQITPTLIRAAQHQAEANELLQILAEQDLQACRTPIPEQLLIPPLLQLAPIRQRNALRYWLKNLNLPLPSAIQLQHILNDVIAAAHDRQPIVQWQGIEIRRYQQSLFALPCLPPAPTTTLIWQFPEPLQLPFGQLVAIHSVKGGLQIPVPTPLQVRFRQGGERCRLRGQQRVVKKLLQTIPLPTWQRPFLPLIYFQDELIAIPEIGVCDGFRAQVGWQIQWIR